jgi:DeoR/GlpR family transcriptional regulator of sugar metabolism
MLAAERHAAILAALDGRPVVRVTELAGKLGVSEMTVRRDIDALSAAGSVHRIHGGAARAGVLAAAEPGFPANARRQAAEKRAIARAAAQLVLPGMTISVTGGTTTVQLVDHLARIEGLTVVTNSLPAADRLHRLTAGGRGPAVLLTGGERSPSEALVGPLATAAIRALNVDLCFMGVHGVDVDAGITTPNLAEAETNRAFADGCGHLVVLADSTKFGVVSLARITGLDETSCLITDTLPAEPGFARHTLVTTPETIKDARKALT